MDAMMLIFQARIEALVTEREAMKAANYERKENGMDIAYDAGDFMELSERFAQIEEAIKNHQ